MHFNDVRILKNTYDQMEQGWLEFSEEKKEHIHEEEEGT